MENDCRTRNYAMSIPHPDTIHKIAKDKKTEKKKRETMYKRIRDMQQQIDDLEIGRKYIHCEELKAYIIFLIRKEIRRLGGPFEKKPYNNGRDVCRMRKKEGLFDDGRT